MMQRVPIVAKNKFFPTYAHPGDAGADLRSLVATTVEGYGRMTVPTGVRLALPEGYMAMVVPRSGLASKSGITVLNAPGIIDAGYRGEISVVLHNTTGFRHIVNVGDRIAQLVLVPFVQAAFEPTLDLDDTDRGAGGFGSTGS